jgi:hypothetical protein
MFTIAVDPRNSGAMQDMRATSLAFARRLFAALGASFFASSVLLFPVFARPLVPAERRYSPYDGVLPACDDPAVAQRISWNFRQREDEFWDSGLEILGFGEVRETGYKTNGLDYIPRRYCRARAWLNDQRKPHQVFYAISEDLGIIGIGFGIEWCIVGLDRNDAFAPNCKMARP